ncbi:MAG: transposase, partial [Planctomycetota bacterium]
MKIPRRPHRVQYVSADDKITSFSGLKLVMDLAHELGIVQDLSSLLTVKKRRRGIPIADFVMSLVSNFVIGGEHLTDLSQLRDEKATRSLLYGLDVPAATTAGETLRKFTIGHVKQVERVIANALARTADRTNGLKPITLDVDSSIFEVHGYLKEGARYGYTRVNG